MQDIFSALEFERIADELASFAYTEMGKAKALSLHIYPEDELAEELLRFEECLKITSRYGDLPISPCSDISIFVKNASKGSILNEEELHKVSLVISCGEALKKYGLALEEDSSFKDYLSSLPSLTSLGKEISRVIAEDLSIKDGASPKLRSIRSSIARITRELKGKALDILSKHKSRVTELSLVMKGGHYALPVKNSYKREVGGLILDVSNSGETVYIEPEELVAMDYRINSLYAEEKEEIRRILKELSALVGEKEQELALLGEKVGYLDFLSAKGKYKEKIRGVIASFPKTRSIILVDAYHPLLEVETIVPNTFLLNEENPILIISGPNAGGKSIALKTMAISLLMNECGLPVPAKEASLPYFSSFYIDIGDNQSLSENLSTFSSKMSNLASFLDKVDSSSIVFLDELGTGTSPKEGEALSIAITKYLRNRGAYALISSHYEGLKAFALEAEGVKNASLLFDELTLLPTYKLRIGIPGESYGLEVAERYHLPKEIIDESRKIVSSSETLSVKSAIEKLEKSAKESDALLEELRKKEDELDRQKLHVEKMASSLDKRDREFEKAMREEKERLLDEYEEKLKGLLLEASFGKKPHEITEIRHKMREEEKVEEKEKEPSSFSIGEYVRIPSLFAEGRIVSLSGDKCRIDSRDGITYRVKTNQLEKAEEPTAPDMLAKHQGQEIDLIANSKSLPLELNIIGLRADEAERELIHYLDSCRIKNYKRVRIIHGFGSGILRKMVERYCANHQEFVLSYESASGEEGGGGATIVHLK